MSEIVFAISGLFFTAYPVGDYLLYYAVWRQNTMDLEHDLVFAYLEEDNIQRAYFRVHPLLTPHGLVQEEAVQFWPDEGCLRIVPDRAEQHTFKDRMRALGHYCAVDLRGISAEAGKIRTNKNYRPDRGEINQYILYSDAVKPLPSNTFFEVLEGLPTDAAALAAKAVTPLFFVHHDDMLFGPVTAAVPTEPQPAAEAAATLFPLTTPDGVSRLMLCMPTPAEAHAEVSAAPVPVKEAVPLLPVSAKEDEVLPLGQHLDILDTSKTHDETLQDLAQPLSRSANLLRAPAPHQAVPPMPRSQEQHRPGILNGTPLVRTQFKTSVPQPKNKLQEVVSSQWRVARYEPPADSLPVGATMRHVDNPVENACQSLKAAWQVPEVQNQLIDFLLSLDGMQAKLEPRLMPSDSQSPLQKAIVRHLEDLEAERLSALIQLDKAKADVETFRKTALAALSDKARAEYTQLCTTKAEHEASIAQLKEQLSVLLAQRDELLTCIDDLQHAQLPAVLAKAAAAGQLNIPASGIPLRMNRQSGVTVSAEELIHRVDAVLANRNEAVVLLALLAVCPMFGLTASIPAVAATTLRNTAAALGWLDSYAQQVSPEQQPMTSAAPADTTPAILLTALANYAPLPSVTKVLLGCTPADLTTNPAYTTVSWPILPLCISATVTEADVPQAVPVSAASLQTLAQQSSFTTEQIDAVLADVFAACPPISGKANAEMHQFIQTAAPWLDGGLAAACDWAILMWLIPATDRTTAASAQFKSLLQEYPLSLAYLQ